MVWPLLPTDAAALRQGFTELSPESRRARFLVPLNDLDPAMLRRLVADVDQEAHVALVLVALPFDGDEEPVGVGRLVQYGDDPTTAELAVTVADDWQGKGVGSVLAAALVAVRPAQVTTLVTEVAVGNNASLAMLRRLGPTRTRLVHPGVFEVAVDLVPQPAVAAC